MKKLMTGMLLVAAFLVAGLLLMQTAQAAAAEEVIIDGIALNNGKPAAGFSIAGNCRGQHFGNFVGFGTTDSDGHYVIHTTTDKCPLGSIVEVRADKDGDGKFESSALGTASNHTTLNITLGINIAVPEYSRLSGVVAVSIGVGTIAFVRRRYDGLRINL